MYDANFYLQFKTLFLYTIFVFFLRKIKQKQKLLIIHNLDI